ncbi:MAG: subclass B3 metallo-beta-lactamase [Chthoniobacterales bacterium]|jgi:metallo-beta-lactamase class B
MQLHPTIAKFRLGLFAIAFASSVPAQQSESDRASNQPLKPFRVIGNIYYVGASEVTSFLITGNAGHILLDAGFAETAPQIEQNIAALGFRLADVKILLNSQAHFDHAGGLAKLKRLTGARMIASAADAEQIARGGKGDFAFGDRLTYEPVKADRFVADNEVITLGDTKLTAHLTPGHTKGCTTWTISVAENNKTYQVVFLGGVTIPGYKLVRNAEYPNIADDYARSFALLKGLPCDVFLGAHGSYFGLQEKLAHLGETPNPFIDPDGYRRHIDKFERAFHEQLDREKRAAATAD